MTITLAKFFRQISPKAPTNLSAVSWQKLFKKWAIGFQEKSPFFAKDWQKSLKFAIIT
jgi:hypothetical protein